MSVVEGATGEEVFRRETRGFESFGFAPDGRGLVVADWNSLSVWDADTGERWHQMVWPESIRDGHGKVEIRALALLSGGRAATGMKEGDILVWDLAPASWPGGKPARDLGRKELDALWSDLAGDARTAHRALHTLTAAPAQALALLHDRLRPMAGADTKRVEKLLGDLDSDNFTAREAATRELDGLREQIEPILRLVLRGRPSLEMRRRLQAILARPLVPPAETRRTLRALTVLERIGTPEARRLLKKLSAGADTRATRAAKATLQRLNRHEP